jgi:acyl-CoA reductase-like NAD-dependent aldehyde dehydrogenase
MPEARNCLPGTAAAARHAAGGEGLMPRTAFENASFVEVRSPATGEVLRRYRPAAAGDILLALTRGREAFARWRNVPPRERAAALRRLRHAITDNLDTVVKCIVQSTGKVPAEALASDVYPSLDFLRYYEKNAAAILRMKKVKTPFIYRHARSYVSYQPLGVVLVIAPWNYPLLLALVPAISALAAGNAVVLKPSELTLPVGGLIEDLCRKAALPARLLQVVYGDGETGRRLIAAGPDKIFFTGGAATGRKVMAAAAEQLIPVDLELGAKDPMIVLDDAHFGRAVEAAVYGAFSNSGQACVSVERLYVQKTIYERFIEALARRADAVRAGAGFEADTGAVISAAQAAVINEHLRDAAERGARLLNKVRWDGLVLKPVVVAGANHTMKIMTEETFGPVLPVMPFTGDDEAAALANDSAYGLSASIWTGNLRRGERLAKRLAAGNCVINDVIKNIANPYLPFGGVKKSGFGRYHGPDGLYTFTNKMAVMVNTGKSPREINWFPYTRPLYDGLAAFIGARFGGAPLLRKLQGLLRARRAIALGEPK